MSPDLAAWVELWRAMKDVTLVGHRPGGPCPYQIGHTMREHFIAGEWPLVELRLQEIINLGLHLDQTEQTP
jgi:hypothetical protein